MNYYEILEIPRWANDDAVNAAYRKLARLLHPDKNSAPGSTQAFQGLLFIQIYILISFDLFALLNYMASKV